MPVTKELKRGDPCPTCGGKLVKAPVPTEEQWRKATDRENPQALPPGLDNATPEQRAELGELHRCERCGYSTRFPATKSGDKDKGARRGDAAAERPEPAGESDDNRDR
jgi:ssDNA-binding Zn-finger/Zn-ribbon topoisomerase 1